LKNKVIISNNDIKQEKIEIVGQTENESMAEEKKDNIVECGDAKDDIKQEKIESSLEMQTEGNIIESSVEQEEKIDNIVEHINKGQNLEESFSFQRYIINVIVRFAFCFFPIPVHFDSLEFIHYLPLVFFYLPWEFPYLPLGFSIAVTGLIVGGALDILLPRKYVIGGKIVAKTFNIGTLSWFEGIKFSVSVDVGASGKGISVKDERE